MCRCIQEQYEALEGVGNIIVRSLCLPIDLTVLDATPMPKMAREWFRPGSGLIWKYYEY